MGKDTAKRVALYLRVSTDGQTTTNQQRDLEHVARRHGWKVVAIFKDHGISGKNGRQKHPGYDQLLHGIARREFDLVAAWSVDRLGRSLQELVAFLTELRSKGMDLYLHQQALDTSTPAGEALFQICGVFAQYQTALIRERVKAGFKRAEAQGKKLGRPSLDPEKTAQIRTYLAERRKIREIAKLVGVGLSTVWRVKHGTRERLTKRFTPTTCSEPGLTH